MAVFDGVVVFSFPKREIARPQGKATHAPHALAIAVHFAEIELRVALVESGIKQAEPDTGTWRFPESGSFSP